MRSYRILSFGKHSAMLMLRSYMDEAGKYDDPKNSVVSVCGVISSLDKWTEFEREWKAVLDEFGISSFHMKEFAQFKGEFKGWPEEKRQALLAKFIDVMDNRVMGCLAATMSVWDFNNLKPEEREAIGGDPYYPCLMGCVIHSAQTVHNLAPEETIEVIFADNPGFKTKAYEFWTRIKSENVPWEIRDRLGPITLDAKPKDVLPLQAADLVVYEVNLHWRKIMNQGKWPEERWAYTRLKNRMFFIEYFDKPTLAERFGFKA